MSDNGKIIGALLLGVAAGAAVGMLFAPEKGSKTRKQLTDTAGGLVDQLTEKIEEGKSALKELKEKATNKADEFASKAKSKFNEYESDAETEVDYLKNKAKQVVSNSVR